ncbi:MAG: copper amine oxidase N-terminal domain-containing protein [Fimbriimonadales bacterium]|nr:copper amine oxidase N-terminal domain-containing protein [Fimbriimonadales bacterium]
MMRTMGMAALAATAIAIPSARAQTIRIPAGTVLKVTFEQSLGLERNREGDRFRARVKDDRELEGSLLEGRVVRVVPNEGRRKGFLELEFNRLTLPEGASARVQALPIRWSEKDLRRQPDGRFVSKTPVSRDRYVAGGMIGGLVLGSLLKKPFEGAFLGSLAGILLAEADDNKSGELVVRRGETYGAYFERSAEIRLDDQRDRWSGDERRDRSEERRWEDRRWTEGGGLSVLLDGRELAYDQDLAPFEADGVAMVPLDATARQLGLTVERVRRDDGRDFFLIEGERGLLRLNLGLETYRVNGEERRMPRNPEVRRGVVYVPIDVLESLAEGKLEARLPG